MRKPYIVTFCYLNPYQVVGPCREDNGETIRFATLREAETAARQWNQDYCRDGQSIYFPSEDCGR